MISIVEKGFASRGTICESQSMPEVGLGRNWEPVLNCHHGMKIEKGGFLAIWVKVEVNPAVTRLLG